MKRLSTRGKFSTLRFAVLGAAVLLTAACAGPKTDLGPNQFLASGIDPNRKAEAITEVKAKNARGERVWCVPFARTASGIDIRGNAGTWWHSAAGEYARGDAPVPGSVMAFSSSRKNPMGHVAVVSQVISEREIRIDHANWDRNRLSLGQKVIDISKKGDWSSVKVESTPGAFGSAYPIDGFIYPKTGRLPG